MRKRDEYLEKQLQEWLAQAAQKEDTTARKALVLNAAAQLYRASGNEVYKAPVISALKQAITQDGSMKGLDVDALTNFLMGNVLYFAYDQTGDSIYESAAKTLAGQLNTQARGQDGVFVCADGAMRLADAYCSQVFYMNYETRNGGKERYNDIIAQYNGMHQNQYLPVRSELGRTAVREEAAYYAAALIDTMEVMEQPIYEIFRRLEALYKNVIADLLAVQTSKGQDPLQTGALMSAYAILKGCRMKALHTEKYEGGALAVLDSAIQAVKEAHSLKDSAVETVCALALAYSESLKNRAYQDYGRNKGGVLWS